MITTDAGGCAHQRYEDTIPLPGMSGSLDEMAMYAGQSVELVRDTLPAAQIVRAIASEATQVIERLAR